MSNVLIGLDSNRRLVLKTPYDAAFVADLKAKVHPRNRGWDSATKSWSVDVQVWPATQAIILQHWPNAKINILPHAAAAIGVTNEPPPEMPEYVDDVFREGSGMIAKQIPAYEAREGQIQLATAIDHNYRKGDIFLGEAPCGVGKSFAYGSVAARHAADGEKTVIVTANKSLQDQLVQKDLPFLSTTLPWKFSFAPLKGRNNYFCKYKGETESDLMGLWVDQMSQQERDESDAIQSWAEISETGDRSDQTAPQVSEKTWSKFSMSADECLYGGCKFRKECFAERAKAQAVNSDIIVANYHAFFFDLAKREDSPVLRDRHVVMDEAHEAADIARDCLGYNITESGINRLASMIHEEVNDKSISKPIKTAAKRFFDDVAEFSKAQDGSRIDAPDFVDATELLTTLDEALHEVKPPYCPGCSCRRCSVGGIGGGECEDCEAQHMLSLKIEQTVKNVRDAVAQSDPNKVYSIRRFKFDDDAREKATIRVVEFDVGQSLAKLFDKKFKSISAVSATMTTAGSFEFVKREMGLLNAKTLQVESPFDYAKQALLVVPGSMPLPDDPNFDDAAAQTIYDLIIASQGRLLALFTSWKRLRHVRDFLRTKNVPYPVYAQGDQSDASLASSFREEVDSCLLATRKFWTGLDVPGESLTTLVLDKLPFPQQDDPVVDMLQKRQPKSWFGDYYLPKAVVTFAQGVGRLIRSKNDIGVVVVLDKRLITKSYRSDFAASTPIKNCSINVQSIPVFLNQQKGP